MSQVVQEYEDRRLQAGTAASRSQRTWDPPPCVVVFTFDRPACLQQLENSSFGLRTRQVHPLAGRLRTGSLDVPSRPPQLLTTDGVSLKVKAVVFYRVVDPSLWVTRVQDGYLATHTQAQTALRAALGACTLSEALTQRSRITRRLEVSDT